MPDFKTLLTNLNIKFYNQSLLEEAFTHRSYLNESTTVKNSNERLEFLGDTILSFIVSHHLYESYPQHPEGLLTNLRSAIVKTETLADIAKTMNLGEYLLLSRGEEKGGGRTNISLLADTFEALIAAIYLDQGLAVVSDFLHQQLFPIIPEILKKELFSDYKSKLQELVQTTSDLPPNYKVVKTEGPDHDKMFWVKVVIDGKDGEVGMGKSKQEAEQESARKTLEKMGKI